SIRRPKMLLPIPKGTSISTGRSLRPLDVSARRHKPAGRTLLTSCSVMASSTRKTRLRSPVSVITSPMPHTSRTTGALLAGSRLTLVYAGMACPTLTKLTSSPQTSTPTSTTLVPPLYHPCTTLVPPLYHPCTTLVPPLYHPCTTLV